MKNTVAEKWEIIKALLPKGMTEHEEWERKKMFYCGAIMMFDLMVDAACRSELSNEVGQAMVDSWDGELDAFKVEMVQRDFAMKQKNNGERKLDA